MSTDRFLRQNPNPVPLDTLSTPDFDVREYRTDADIENIRESMDNKGQIMPILLGSPDNGVYPILDGNHRYLAAKRAGWPDIDAIQTGASIQDDEAQIISNISRLELSQQEKLSTFDYMLTVLDYSQTEAADAVGFDRSQVTRYAGILNGYGEVKEYFIQGELGVLKPSRVWTQWTHKPWHKPKPVLMQQQAHHSKARTHNSHQSRRESRVWAVANPCRLGH